MLGIPFIFTNDRVGNIGTTSGQWLGHIETGSISPWVDLLIAMVCWHLSPCNDISLPVYTLIRQFIRKWYISYGPIFKSVYIAYGWRQI